VARMAASILSMRLAGSQKALFYISRQSLMSVGVRATVPTNGYERVPDQGFEVKLAHPAGADEDHRRGRGRGF